MLQGFCLYEVFKLLVNERFVAFKANAEKVSDAYFFLCLFALALFLRLCVEIFALFLFLPLGIIRLFY